MENPVVNGLRAVHCCVMWLGVNGTETVHYGIRVGVKCPQDIEQLQKNYNFTCLLNKSGE